MYRLNNSHRRHQARRPESIFFVSETLVHIAFGVLLLRGEKCVAGQAIGPGVGDFDNRRILSGVDRGGDTMQNGGPLWLLP